MVRVRVIIVNDDLEKFRLNFSGKAIHKAAALINAR